MTRLEQREEVEECGSKRGMKKRKTKHNRETELQDGRKQRKQEVVQIKKTKNTEKLNFILYEKRVKKLHRIRERDTVMVTREKGR